MRRFLFLGVLVVWAAAPATALADRPGTTLGVRPPLGRQYALVGVGTSAWFGSGTIRELNRDGRLGAEVGEFSDRAWGVGPVWVGIGHMVARSVMFEGRFGLGALVFENDRLVSAVLDGRGKSHVGLTIEAEVLGRYIARSGLTAGMGINIGSVGIPDGTGALLRASPRAGFLRWDTGFEGFWLFEIGYQIPVIDGLEPDIAGVRFHPPVNANWHIVTAAVTRGF
jgi:hypothetical protein